MKTFRLWLEVDDRTSLLALSGTVRADFGVDLVADRIVDGVANILHYDSGNDVVDGTAVVPTILRMINRSKN